MTEHPYSVARKQQRKVRVTVVGDVKMVCSESFWSELQRELYEAPQRAVESSWITPRLQSCHPMPHESRPKPPETRQVRRKLLSGQVHAWPTLLEEIRYYGNRSHGRSRT